MTGTGWVGAMLYRGVQSSSLEGRRNTPRQIASSATADSAHTFKTLWQVWWERRSRWRTKSEYARLVPHGTAPESQKAQILSEGDLKELRHNLAHLSAPAVRDFYERVPGSPARLRPPCEPRQMQTLVQEWKQLW
jgi:hypothetical protein